MTGGAPGSERITAPRPLRLDDDLSQFDSGSGALDAWLRSRAHKAEGSSGRTYVVCRADAVIGYYTLATGAARRDETPSKVRRNAPEQVPLLLLARLAVDRRFQGGGIGSGLLKDALLRAVQTSEIVGVRAVLVHAIDEQAQRFYARYGFVEFPNESRTLFLPVDSIKSAL